ncbi:zeta toxin [Arcicella aurantiaca]|uniref:Zeta toxin n=2 Tax=Arcicella aurantiaca TaxID=591202 RepID=A0A316DH10_9BACT|nr:zeta toxin [Arcicella aurantiaca]
MLRIELFGNRQAEEMPTCYIVGGQPSSGKTSLNERIIEGFRETKIAKPVIINGNELKRFHPNYDEYFQEDSKESTVSPQLFANILVDYFQEYALEKRISFILDVTMRTLATPLTTIHKAQKKNYRIETHILAVHQQRSWVGVHERYESQKAYLGKGQFIYQDLHDTAFDNIPRVADVLYQDPEALNKMVIYTAQAQNIIYETQRISGGKWDNEILPSEILHQERNRIMDSQEEERISWGWNLIRAKQ